MYDSLMALPSDVFEQSTSKVLSIISTKLDDKASRAETIARIEIAVHRIDFILEKTGKIATTYVSLLRSWNALKLQYTEGMDLLNKYKPQQELDGQVAERSSSYFHRFAKRAANLSSSLVGLVNEQLSPTFAQRFERYADWAEKSFVADVESSCPLRHDTFRYPFLRQLFQGRTLLYATMKGRKEIYFCIWPVILEGRGVEASLFYKYFDPERLDKSFRTVLMLRISESTDIVGAALNCLQSSASLLSPVAQDAAAQLTQLHYFQDIADSCEPPLVSIEEWYPVLTKIFRSDPLCCQAGNGHQPSVDSIISSELSQIFPEQTILFRFQCYVPMLECRLGTTSDEAHRNAMVNQRSRPQPLVVIYDFAPHFLSPCMVEANCTTKMTKKEGCVHDRMPGNSSSMETNICLARLAGIYLFTNEPDELTSWEVEWTTKHGAVRLMVEKSSQDSRSAHKTRSAKKRKK